VRGYCFDTDVISATIKPPPPLHLIRRLATVPAAEQFTTSITVGELIYGARRVGRESLTTRVEAVVRGAQTVLPFDTVAARRFGELKAELERRGEPLAEPDLRIAAIAVSRGLTLVTRNVRRFRRVPGLAVENWIDDSAS
jgi:tRNA(fMet)-specific endonuclease VapC